MIMSAFERTAQTQLFRLHPPGAQFPAPDEPAFETEAKLETFSSSFLLLQAGHLTSVASEALSSP
jgi:hypothetical protein